MQDTGDMDAAQPRLHAGLDLGSTGIKMLVIDDAGAELAGAQVPTPWRVGPGGTTDIDAADLLSAVRALIDLVDAELAPASSAPLTSLAVAGMGETGILIDADGAAAAPGYAWFDPRGWEQIDAFPAEVRDEFAGRTGLPLGAQVSVAKLAWLRDQGTDLAGLRWLDLPEFVVAALGGDVALELSLASRTGLIDQDSGAAWPAMLAALGVDDALLPPLRGGGLPWGTASTVFGPRVAGAALTVAGHDHLVAAQANGTLDADGYHVSLGTAEVLLRVLDEPLGFAARRRLADALINEVRHVVPGKHVLVAGVKTGLLLRRALHAAGIGDRAGRDALDAAVMALPYEGELPAGAIEVTGSRNDDGILRLTLHTEASPAEIFGAVLRHSNDEIAALIAAMDREVAPATHSTLTGGWAGMASVRRARAEVLPDPSLSTREQDVAYGAADMARRLVSASVPS
ncbi:Sugar (pentulose or hexulose) kinase [Microbacterium sp. ru370.1]|uniref:FGGY family carbohydrate kinase n=1 Tax=unclassified Microbacterium TaxID=2609290 RepID=UPI00087FD513|nr:MULTISPECIES: FGGY family carbohydrate kinase [unclassified Microbacterium]SDP06822.1 Sugar (pentulose or hexulose) kinase [Microbacterium sp. ru370.1]SIT93789.1 Sugar (pentulose or hexulose) kinase [Microbacterium sp. RU1D]